MVFIHGFLMSRAIWQDNLESLQNHVRPVVIELPGHGKTRPPATPRNLTFETMVMELESARSALDIPRFYLCGHSFGAALAIAYAHTYPGCVQGVIFTNARAALGALEPVQDRAPLRALVNQLKDGHKSALELIPAHPKRMRGLSASLHKALLDDAEYLNPETIGNLMENALPAADMSAKLSALRMPVLLVNGIRERGFQPARHKLEQLAPHVKVIDIEAGHSVNAEHPEAFNAAIINFLETQDLNP
ncbi:alpha/beta fold hydrolase [Hyphomonas sp.]|uniref:alpha/beta fold hydrolase n=1 Tax=Hyphomonas sp. TaxID=87 RepID=UPI0032EC2834